MDAVTNVFRALLRAAVFAFAVLSAPAFAQSSDADLRELVLTDVQNRPIVLDPPFSHVVTNYTARMPYASTFVNILATSNSTAARAAVVAPASYVVGNNTVTATVTAENTAVKVYTVTLTRMPDIRNISFRGPSGGGQTPSLPAFSPTTLTYHGTIQTGIFFSNVKFNVTFGAGVTAQYKRATVWGSSSLASPGGLLFTSGADETIDGVAADPATDETLEVRIYVMQNNYLATYRVLLINKGTRALPTLASDASLSNIALSPGTLTKTCPTPAGDCSVPAQVAGFASDHFHYELEVAEGTRAVSVTPTLNDSNGSVLLQGARVPGGQATSVILPEELARAFTFTVTGVAQNTSAMREYTFHVPANAPEFSAAQGGLFAYAGRAFRAVLPDAAGEAPLAYSVSALPAGLSFDENARAISGTPALADANPVFTQVTYTVADSRTPPAITEQTFMLGVAPPLAFASEAPAEVTLFVDAAANAILPEAAGGFSPVAYALTGDALPAGLSFDATARAISGTASAIGEATLAYTATDASGVADGVLSANMVVRALKYSLDVDASGAVDSDDGNVIKRYLDGTRGDALFDGQTTRGANAIAGKLQESLDAGAFDVTNTDGANGVDGAIIARYLLGFRKKALFVNIKNVTPAVVEDALRNLSEEDLDADASGTLTAQDGILIARFLLGARGATLVAAQVDATGDVEAHLVAGVDSGILDVDDSGAVTADDGTFIMRYLNGDRGTALTAGISGADDAKITENMEALLAE